MSKILVIDDEQGIRTVLSDVLEDEGFEVITAADGKSGLALLDEGSCDLVILDVWLPDTSGIDILEKISEEKSELPVIIISGHANIDIAVKAVNLGAYDFLEKPLSIDKMITVVNNALEISQLKSENRSLKKALTLYPESLPQGKSLKEAMEGFEKEYISEALKSVDSDIKKAAVKIDMDVALLSKKIKKYRI